MEEAQTVSAPSNAEETRNATRGGLVVLLAKLVFIIGGLAQKILLPRVVGMEGFGAFGRMSALPNVLNNVAVSATIMGVSKSVAASPEPAVTQRQVLRLHMWVALALGAALFFTAPWVAAFQRAPEMVVGLRVMSGVLAAYGLYAACIGVLNGTQRFAVQASFDMAYTVMRTVLMLAGAWVFVHFSRRGEVGAAVGIVAASATILVVSYLKVGGGAAGRSIGSDASYLKALLPVAGVQLVANLLMQADMLWLGRLLTPESPTLAQTAEVNLWCGYYQAATVFAFLPYQLSIAVTQVLLPGVAKAFATGDAEATRAQVQRGARWGLILVGLLAGTVVFLNGNAVSLLFGAAAGSHTSSVVRWLAAAQGLFAMLALGQTVLVAVDRRRHALVAALSTLGVLVVGFSFWVRAGEGIGGQAHELSIQKVLTQVSQCMWGAMASGCVLVAFWVHRAVPKSLPIATSLRVAVWVAGAALAGPALGNLGKVATLVAAAGAVTAYAAYLFLSQELKTDELRATLQLLRRR